MDACGCGGPPTEPQLTIVARSRIAARNMWLNLVFPDDLLGLCNVKRASRQSGRLSPRKREKEKICREGGRLIGGWNTAAGCSETGRVIRGMLDRIRSSGNRIGR